MPRLGQIKESFKSIKKEIKTSLHQEKWKEVLIFFCFVLLSFGFWTLQSLQQEYEIEIEVPVAYKNIPSDITFVGNPPQTIKVRVKDKGSILLNYTFRSYFVPIEVSMDKPEQEDSGLLSLPKQDIESIIRKQLIASTTLVDFTPPQISILYSKLQEKSVPVKFNGKVQTIAGFKVSDVITISPQHVNIYASKMVLDSIQEIKTVYSEYRNSNKTITNTVQLEKIEGAKIDPTNVSITIPIEEYTEKEFQIPVTCKDLPPYYTLRTFPASVKVSCNLPLSRFKEVSEKDFSIQASFADLEHNLTGKLYIRLEKKPEHVDGITITPSQIEFILEQNYE